MPDATRAYLARLMQSILPDSWWVNHVLSTVSSVVNVVQWFGVWDVETIVARANVQIIVVNVELSHLFRQRDLLLAWSVWMLIMYSVMKCVNYVNVMNPVNPMNRVKKTIYSLCFFTSDRNVTR